jgi:broad specificity phosphatase PhoE
MTITLPPPGAGITRLILLRHGEPDETVHGRCYGRLDPGLSPLGREQILHTWRILDNQPVTALYSSPSRRAIESANLRAVNFPAAAVDERLREIDFGAFEGLTYREISSRYPQRYHEWMTQPTDVLFPGGESFATMSARVGDALDAIRRLHSGETVVTVSHGGVNRVALMHALDLDPRHIFRLAQTYACVNVIDYIGDEPVVRVMNATVHLLVRRSFSGGGC